MTIAAMQAVADELAAADIGYDQGQRWSFLKSGRIFRGGESDCSTSCGAIALLGGYPVDITGTFYTGNFADRLEAAGFSVLPFTRLAKVRPGDFLLTPGHHVVFVRDAQRWWSAEFDERGKATGGQAGNQNGQETRYRAPYLRPGGWSYIVRPPAEATTVSTKPGIVPTLARVATFNCAGWGKTSMTAKQIDRIVGVLLDLGASIYCLTECPEWLRDHIRGACDCAVSAHRRMPGGSSRWLVRERGSQAILRDSRKWTSGPFDSDEFGPTSYHGWVWETLTNPVTRAALTVGCYHLPPNTVATQIFQHDGLWAFLAKLPRVGLRLVGGDGADDTGWFTGWADARTAAKASVNRDAPTYQGKAITDRIHGKGITVRRYTVLSSHGASDHDPVLAQVTLPAGADPAL